MTSTMEKWLLPDENGALHLVPKEYPNWYGIEGIGFIFLNTWADPLIEYKGKRCSCCIVEDTMWERYREEGGNDEDQDAFAEYMQSHELEVYELCELALFGEEI